MTDRRADHRDDQRVLHPASYCSHEQDAALHRHHQSHIRSTRPASRVSRLGYDSPGQRPQHRVPVYWLSDRHSVGDRRGDVLALPQSQWPKGRRRQPSQAFTGLTHFFERRVREIEDGDVRQLPGQAM